MMHASTAQVKELMKIPQYKKWAKRRGLRFGDRIMNTNTGGTAVLDSRDWITDGLSRVVEEGKTYTLWDTDEMALLPSAEDYLRFLNCLTGSTCGLALDSVGEMWRAWCPIYESAAARSPIDALHDCAVNCFKQSSVPGTVLPLGAA